MPTYTFRLKGGGPALEDSDGVDLPNVDAALSYRGDVARELMGCRELLSEYWRLDVYENNTLAFQVPLFALNSAFFTPKKRAVEERTRARQLALNELLQSTHITMRESRALVARSRGKPYMVTDSGEEVTRPVSTATSSPVSGRAESGYFPDRGPMVPAEIIRPEQYPNVILVVEDEIFIRLSLADFLRTAGYAVVETGTAYEALTVLKTRSDVALVVTDLNMPGALDGSGLIRQIRKSYPAVKVIVASAFQTNEPVEATVAKPYSLERLLEVVKSVLGN